MGDWCIIIEGIGPHHNTDHPQDADRLARKMVEDLKASGQQVKAATIFTHGYGFEARMEDLTDEG